MTRRRMFGLGTGAAVAVVVALMGYQLVGTFRSARKFPYSMVIAGVTSVRGTATMVPLRMSASVNGVA